VTLEDETGCTNVIVWRDLSDRQRRELLGSRLMAVYGTVEREGDVVHVPRRAARRPHAHARIAADALAGLPLAQPGNFA
jgi:DNA polymerase III alpha subunit